MSVANLILACTCTCVIMCCLCVIFQQSSHTEYMNANTETVLQAETHQ